MNAPLTPGTVIYVSDDSKVVVVDHEFGSTILQISVPYPHIEVGDEVRGVWGRPSPAAIRHRGYPLAVGSISTFDNAQDALTAARKSQA